MTNKYFINEARLGRWATRAHVDQVVRRLRERGFDAAYGDAVDEYDQNAEWDDADEILYFEPALEEETRRAKPVTGLNRFCICEEHLGPLATRVHVDVLIKKLQERGFQVEYGAWQAKPESWDYEEEEGQFLDAFDEELQALPPFGEIYRFIRYNPAADMDEWLEKDYLTEGEALQDAAALFAAGEAAPDDVLMLYFTKNGGRTWTYVSAASNHA